MKITVKIRGCNLECVYCHCIKNEYNSYDKKGVDRVQRILTTGVKNGVEHVHWTGGEPTLHPQFIELVEFANGLGMYQSMATNGTPDGSYFKLLHTAGISRINVSVDTLCDETYQYFTGTKYLQTVLRNIQLFSELFDEPTKVNIVVSNINLNEIRDLYVHFVGCKNIIPRFLELIVNPCDPFVGIKKADLSEIRSILPEGTSKIFDSRAFTNPTAEYYETKQGIYAIVPENVGAELLTTKFTSTAKELAIQVHLGEIK